MAGYVVPDTNELLNASLATSMTLVGALCFLWAARILVKPPPRLLQSTRGGEASAGGQIRSAGTIA